MRRGGRGAVPTSERLPIAFLLLSDLQRPDRATFDLEVLDLDRRQCSVQVGERLLTGVKSIVSLLELLPKL